MQLHRYVVFFALLIFSTVPAWAQLNANFNANNTTGCSNQSTVVSFQDISTGNPVSWLWDFGDASGSTSTLQNPIFVYSQAGCYDVTLTVTDANGITNTVTQNCFIEIFAPPVPNFTVDVAEGCAPLDVCFTDNSTVGGAPITNWQWTLSDGTPGTGPNPCFTFANAPDTIGLVLNVTDGNGCSAFAQFPDVVVVAEPPVLDFAVDVNSACNPPLTVNITNQSLINGATNPVYTWQFPGGTIAGGASTATGFTPPPITYNASGQYDITLLLESGNGCADTLTLPDVVGIGGVTADFTATPTTICEGDAVTFTNNSLGGVTTYGWDFGETPGIDSSDPNPTHIYNTAGTYTVTLQANNAACGDTLVQTNLITVEPRPVAAFTPDRTEDCQPGNPFTFTNSSTGATTFAWDFGDGNTSAQQNPTHTYTALGTYDVCLIATNVQGCSDTVCQTITIQPPQVNFTRDPAEGCTPMAVQFNDVTNSIDPIVTWNWTFGAGATPPTSTLQNPSATFNTAGSYDVTLTITTQNGCTASRTIAGAVRVGDPPQVDFTWDPDTVCLNEPVDFTSVFTDPDWEYFWDFQYVAPGNFVLQDEAPTTTYPDTGRFSVGLIINNQGCRDTLIYDSIIYVSPPRAQFVVDQPLVCGLPAAVAITDSSIGPADTYGWFLNGNLISTDPNFNTLNITNTGSYILTQAILNSATGCADTFSTAINAGNPIANFTYAPTQVCRGEPITFDPAGSQNANFYNWRFFPGVINSANQNPVTYAYADTGVYDVQLIVRDQFQCRDTMLVTDAVTVVGPYANFAGDPVSGCVPLVVQFSDSTTTKNTTPTNWAWDFGDGNTGTGPNPTNTYTQVGSYDVQLTVTDSDGCIDSLTLNNYVQATFPDPGFSVVDSSTCAGAGVQFTNESDGVGMQFLWRFGDGTTSTAPSPVHAYPRDQALPYDSTDVYYDVTLVVSDVNGCVDSVTIDSAVYIEPFRANFGGDPTVGICPPLNTQFADSTIGNVVGWNWRFGDGFGTSVLQNPAYVYLLPGTFDVQLIATHEDGCQDTLLQEDFIELAGPNGTFVVDDDSLCLGDSVSITLITTGASLVNPVAWQDGSVNVLTGLSGIVDTIEFVHLYNNPGTYFPRVVVQDNQGCQVTVPDSPVVRVFRLPDAVISPDPFTGCTPFDVPFADSSVSNSGAAINQWFWDFGNGDTSLLQNPPYTYQDTGTYTVSLRIQDEFGCVDSTTSLVNSLQGVIADFVASDTVNCAPFEVSFTDISSNETPVSWLWDFGDGNTSTASNPSHVYQQNGLYTVSLIVSDAQGCADTLTRTDYINMRNPELNITASDAVGCNPLEVTFRAENIVTDTTIIEYEWCLTEVNTGITVCTPTPEGRDSLVVDFSEPGNYIMTVTVTDALGCTGLSDTVTVDIINRSIPEPINMRRVTVIDDQTMRVDWEPYQGADFVEYVVYRLNGPNPGALDTIRNQATGTYFETNPALNARGSSYCYEVLVLNTCDEYSLPEETEEHCTIDLEVTPDIDALDLSWSAYVGFPVGQYEIYRTDVYDTTAVTLIATVPGGTLTYTDTDMFCRDSVSYRILALGFGAAFQRSYSDLSAEAPIHLEPTEAVDVTVATVVNNEDVTLNWTTYNGYRPDYYLIQRSTDGLSWDSVGTAPMGTLTLTDTTAAVDAGSYYYRVFAIDSCGDVSVAGYIGRTIFLRSQLDNTGRVPLLSWTPYEEWPNGVLNYEIQIFNEETGEWEPVDVTGGNITNYNDNRTDFNQPSFCYRVVAFEVGGNGSSSISNEACVIFGPAIFAPNAFTPNNDGNNDEFRVYAPNAAEATLSIYNRWGELIFETNDISQGWPGTRDGQVVQEGVYVFVVRGVGFEGTTFSRSGSVTLIR